MKYLKTLGLVAVTAALVASLGAPSASATVLCSEPGGGVPVGTTCAAGKAYGANQEIHAVLDQGAATVITTGFLNIECTGSTIKGPIANEGSAAETVRTQALEAFTFEGCNCDVTTIKKGTLEIHWISGSHNGTLTSTGLEVTAQCMTVFGEVHCIYVTNGTDIGLLTGGNPATVDISAVDLPRLTTHALCDDSANWDAKYEITTPKPLYVAAHT